MSGHGNYDQYGKDIVCAGASIMAFSLLNYLLDLKKDLPYELVQGETPLIRLNIGSEEIYIRDDIQNGFKFFDIGIRTLVESYGDYVKLTYQEV